MLDKSGTGGAEILKCLIFKSDFISHFLVQTLLWFPQSNTCFLQQSSSMRDKNSPNFFISKRTTSVAALPGITIKLNIQASTKKKIYHVKWCKKLVGSQLANLHLKINCHVLTDSVTENSIRVTECFNVLGLLKLGQVLSCGYLQSHGSRYYKLGMCATS